MRYKLPTICACCGVERGTKVWSLCKINPLLLNIFRLLNNSQGPTFEFGLKPCGVSKR